MLVFLGYILGLLGAVLFLISGLGLLRMPDTLTRMQAATKASTLGSLLVILAVACFEPQWAFKLIVLAVFILITNPISSSVLAMTTYKRFYKSVYNTSGTDALKETSKENEE
ncbi:MAG: monovalent cation/H(+) antiporter subunit G [Sulfurospirillum sp.]